MKFRALITVFACLLVVSVVAIIMLFPSGAQATEKMNAQGNGDKTPPGLKKIPPGLEKIVFIHYKKERAKPDKPGRPSKEPECYDFMGKGVRWKDLEIVYLIDPTDSGLEENGTAVVDAMAAGAQEWENHTSATLFGGFGCDTSGNLSWDGDPGDEPDGLNELVFADYPQSGVIAVTVVWGYFSGPPSSRKIFEFDILFDTDFQWGIGEGDKMDVQNIATHEIGHGLGLGDVYQDGCSEVTMYGFSEEGETIKQTLEQPDITAIQELYGAP
jgi:hypothetical protein